MRTDVRIWFDGNNIAGGAEAVLGPAGCGPDVTKITDAPVLKQVIVWVTLDATDPRLPVLCRLLEQHGEEWLEYRDDVYTEEELDRARLIVMRSQTEVFGGPRVGTTYDMRNACPVCGAGARQTSAQMIAARDARVLRRLRAASTCYSDILVDEALARELEAAGVTGLSLRDVLAAKKDKSRTKLPWRQLCAGRTLPPISPRSTGIYPARLCPRCGRSGHSLRAESPKRFVYRARDIEHAEDVNVTWEWFGEWQFDGDVSQALFAYPFMLVTPRVWRVFRDAGVTSFDWLPIRVDDSGE